jgi:beta-lactamase class A
MAFAILLGAILAAAEPPAGDSWAESRARVEQLISRSGAEASVALRTLDGARELMIEADREYHAASTMKVPVMIELFRQVEAGRVQLDASVVVRNEFRSIVDGSPYALSIEDDSDPDLYALAGNAVTFRRLCESMITASSNLAANILIDRLGVDNIRATVHGLKADGMNVLRGLEDSKAFERGMNNTTTARGLLVLLDAIAQGRAVSREASREMVEILKRQRFNDAIPAGLPPFIAVAHKTGEITRIHHDAAIVYGPRPFVLVILVRGIEDRRTSAALMEQIARVLYAELAR